MDEGNELELRRKDGELGGTMRLGAYEALLAKDSHVAAIYGATRISERHRHRYEVNMKYRNQLEAAGLRFTGLSPDGLLPEIVQIPTMSGSLGYSFIPSSSPGPLSRIPSLHPSSMRPWSRAASFRANFL